MEGLCLALSRGESGKESDGQMSPNGDFEFGPELGPELEIARTPANGCERLRAAASGRERARAGLPPAPLWDQKRQNLVHPK